MPRPPHSPDLPELPLCPCGSGEEMPRCCGPIVAGHRLAPTAAQLMRSRYTAFATGSVDHLLRTWHPSTRPDAAELSASVHDGTSWRRLVVHATEAGGPFDDRGTVEFTAIATGPDGEKVRLRELSRFARDGADRAWMYVDGDVS